MCRGYLLGVLCGRWKRSELKGREFGLKLTAQFPNAGFACFQARHELYGRFLRREPGVISRLMQAS